MTRSLFTIWQESQPRPWRIQMKNYVAQFETEEQARRYVTAMKRLAEAQVKIIKRNKVK